MRGSSISCPRIRRRCLELAGNVADGRDVSVIFTREDASQQRRGSDAFGLRPCPGFNCYQKTASPLTRVVVSNSEGCQIDVLPRKKQRFDLDVAIVGEVTPRIVGA